MISAIRGRYRVALPVLYFAAVSLIVWASALFSSGFVLLGDMVFTPAMNPGVSLLGPARGTMNVTIIYWAAWAVSRLISAVLLEKLVLFLLVFLPGYLMYRNVPTESEWARFFAGSLYAVNPFIYTRLIMGQWGLVLAYALLPVVFASALKTVRAARAGSWARTAVWISIAAILNLQLGLIAILLVFAVFVSSLRRSGLRKVVLSSAVILLLFILLSAFWIVPLSGSADVASAMGRADLRAFETRSTSSAGTGISVLGMYGFWKTQIDALMSRKNIPLWPLFAFGFAVLAIYGAISKWRDPDRGPAVKVLGVLMVVAFFLALGSKAPVTGPIFVYLYDHLSVVKLFREPQKFVALLTFSYATLGAIGLERILARGARRRRDSQGAYALIAVVLIALTFFYGFRSFGALWGEARAVSYPRSWSEAQEFLKRDTGDWRALYLPPYWYMRFDFTRSNYTITSPMPFYFENRYVQLLAIDAMGTRLDEQTLDKYVSSSLRSAQAHGNLGAMLAPLNVRYILMVQNPASVNFQYVLRQRDLEIVARWPDLVLLRNRVPVSRVVAAPGNGSYTSWTGVGGAARGGNLIGSFIIKGTATDVPAAQGRRLPQKELGCGKASVRVPEAGGTILLSETFNPGWRLNGMKPVSQLGLTCAFPLSNNKKPVATVEYRDISLMIGYCLSGAAALLCMIIIVLDRSGRRRKAE